MACFDTALRPDIAPPDLLTAAAAPLLGSWRSNLTFSPPMAFPPNWPTATGLYRCAPMAMVPAAMTILAASTWFTVCSTWSLHLSSSALPPTFTPHPLRLHDQPDRTRHTRPIRLLPTLHLHHVTPSHARPAAYRPIPPAPDYTTHDAPSPGASHHTQASLSAHPHARS